MHAPFSGSFPRCNFPSDTLYDCKYDDVVCLQDFDGLQRIDQLLCGGSPHVDERTAPRGDHFLGVLFKDFRLQSF